MLFDIQINSIKRVLFISWNFQHIFQELNSPNTSTKLVPIQIKEELEYKQDKEDSDYDAYADEAYAADEESNSR